MFSVNKSENEKLQGNPVMEGSQAFTVYVQEFDQVLKVNTGGKFLCASGVGGRVGRRKDTVLKYARVLFSI